MPRSARKPRSTKQPTPIETIKISLDDEDEAPSHRENKQGPRSIPLPPIPQYRAPAPRNYNARIVPAGMYGRLAPPQDHKRGDNGVKSAPAPAHNPAPRPAPDPTPRPAPDPAHGPAPLSAPRPTPDPVLRPAPNPAPRPAPDPAPGPVPRSVPRSVHSPAPRPAPRSAPRPASTSKHVSAPPLNNRPRMNSLHDLL
ncbi:hypothetical protein FRC07_008585 [Ceratobasidium sp. 392]|nr:hypothetical protein FRC07_008585 [Ceratobasidium sp. 392]